MREYNNQEAWLKTYLENIERERICALNKMDTTADWAMGITGLIVVATFTSFGYINYSQYLPLIGIYFNIVFLCLESKRYGFFDKWLFLATKIEHYFLTGEGDKGELIETIKKYDLTPIKHGGGLRLTKRWRTYRRLNAFYKYPIFLLAVVGIVITKFITGNYFLLSLYLFLMVLFGLIILIGDFIGFRVFKKEHDPELPTN